MKFFVLIHFLFSITSLFGGVIEENLKKIPEKDKFLIREFVKINFKWDQLPYVLFFDNKPCAFAGAFIEAPHDIFQNVLWLKGWETFKKHETLFPHSNFIFNSYLHEKDEEGYQLLNLFIINKRALIKCFNFHKKTFQEILGKEISSEHFLAELEKNGLPDVIKHNEVLLGILLGFGKESSQAFTKHQENDWGYCLIKSEIYCGNSPVLPEDYNFFPVVFMGNPQSEEVQSLIATYQRESEVFHKLSQNKDPLILFLEGICEQKENGLLTQFHSKSKTCVDFAIYVMLNPFSINYK